jgi:hypothetical protein
MQRILEDWANKVVEDAVRIFKEMLADKIVESIGSIV